MTIISTTVEKNHLEEMEYPSSPTRESEILYLEANRDHSVVFEISSKYCISDSFVDHDGYSISSK